MTENYILTNTELNVKTNTFFDDYQRLTNDRSSKQAIGKLLNKINIKPIKLSNNAGYKYFKSCDELLEEFNKFKWMDTDNDVINPTFSSREFLDEGINHDEKEINYKVMYENLQKENEELKNKLKLLEPVKTTTKTKSTFKK